MHIAICDDNVADRKQLERLLGRESDVRKDVSGVFYIDSYGNSEGLYSKRKVYDLFFIDIVDSDLNGYELSLKLIEGGVTAPIVLCPSKIDYEKLIKEDADTPSNLLLLNKPVLKAELAAVLDKAVVLESSQEPTIELRSETDTYYLLEDDIVCCEQTSKISNYIDVTLKDGRVISIRDNILNLYSHIGMYTHFQLASGRAIINGLYIERLTPFEVVLTNDKKIKTGLHNRSTIKNVMEAVAKENKNKGENKQ